jgi:hypothetical protein
MGMLLFYPSTTMAMKHGTIIDLAQFARLTQVKAAAPPDRQPAQLRSQQ